MFPLGTGGDFKPAAKQVKALGQGRVVFIEHVVERPDGKRPVRDEYKITAIFFFHVGSQSPFRTGVQVPFLFRRKFVALIF